MNDIQRLENELVISILSRQQLGDCITAGLSIEDFTIGFHRRVFKYAGELYSTGQPITLDALRERFSQNGGVSIAEERALVGASAGTTDLDMGQVARILVDNAERRRVSHKLREASQALVGGAGLDSVIGDVSQYLHRRQIRLTGGISLAEAEKQADAYRSAAVIPTGWSRLDSKLAGGMRSGDLMVIAGWLKHGKTCWLLNLLAQVAGNGIPVAMISLEVGVESCWNQLVAREARQPHNVIRHGRSNLKIEEARLKVRALPLHFEPSLAEEKEVFRAIERAAASGARVIAVDYYQCITVEKSRYRSLAQGLTEVAIELKATARRTGTVVVVAAQLKQPTAQEKNLNLSGRIIADSSGLEKSLDIRLHIDGPPPTEEEMEVIIDLWLMQRNGPGGKIPMRFHKSHRLFEELDFGSA